MSDALGTYFHRQLFLSEGADFAAEITVPDAPFALLVAADARSASDLELRAFARRLLQSGAITVATWGPDCERLHDAFDDEREGFAPPDSVVMTSWHDGEPVEEALWFAITSAPAEPLEPPDRFCAVVVGNADWSSYIRTRLVRPETLDDSL